jgi:alkylation response protein AidB-like acyl-CoA dehydrogenase
MTYRAPVEDLVVALYAAAGLGRLEAHVPGLDRAMAAAVLEAAGELASGVLEPLNRPGDLQGSRLQNGRVVSPDGFPAAYRAFVEGGWNSLSALTEHGGQGLPKALELAVFEMVNSANMAFALCPTLTQAAIEALQTHGTPRQKALYLPRLVTGEWPGTMHLTEPQAGSDLSLIRTIASPAGDGAWRLNGQKIFITWGDHDLSGNIVHLILARTPDAPEGVRGLSLFLAPSRLVDEEGRPGAANGLRVASLEHKLGLHASPTCVMLYEDARAELVGELHQGLPHMFTMMNAARVAVGVQGVGIAEAACQKALAYARERRQGRSPWSTSSPAIIADHPDVRRMLLLMKAKTQAARAICLSAGAAADLARLSPDPDERAGAARKAELLTPIAKAWSTDVGVEVASLGVQVHGGMGYIEETGAAQFYRDARIAPIYEGANGIQAIDLVGRKLAMDGGQAVTALLAEVRQAADLAKASPGLEAVAARIAAGAAALEAGAGWLAAHGGPDALAGASAFLTLAGDVLGGALLARMAAVEGATLGLRALLARIYGEQVLALAPARLEAVRMGAADLEAAGPALD